MRLTILLTVILFYLGCAGSPGVTGMESMKNREKMLELQIGMTKEQVKALMGQPYKTEAYQDEGGVLEFWLYMTEAVTIDNRQLSDENFTPFAFRDGVLVGWGRNYYESALNIKVEQVK